MAEVVLEASDVVISGVGVVVLVVTRVAVAEVLLEASDVVISGVVVLVVTTDAVAEVALEASDVVFFRSRSTSRNNRCCG